MSQQYDDLMGDEQPQETHPNNSMNYKMAGDVVPIRQGEDFYTTANIKAAAGDVVNRLIARGGLGGYKNSDLSNIKILRPSGK